MSVPCLREREIRKVAREQNIPILDVERIRKMFEEFDVDGSDEIEEAEFRHILYRLWNVKDVSDVPVKRLHRLWRELDTDNSGSIGFTEFLVWYQCLMAGETKKNFA